MKRDRSVTEEVWEHDVRAGLLSYLSRTPVVPTNSQRITFGNYATVPLSYVAAASKAFVIACPRKSPELIVACCASMLPDNTVYPQVVNMVQGTINFNLFVWGDLMLPVDVNTSSSPDLVSYLAGTVDSAKIEIIPSLSTTTTQPLAGQLSAGILSDVQLRRAPSTAFIQANQANKNEFVSVAFSPGAAIVYTLGGDAISLATNLRYYGLIPRADRLVKQVAANNSLSLGVGSFPPRGPWTAGLIVPQIVPTVVYVLNPNTLSATPVCTNSYPTLANQAPTNFVPPMVNVAMGETFVGDTSNMRITIDGSYTSNSYPTLAAAYLGVQITVTDAYGYYQTAPTATPVITSYSQTKIVRETSSWSEFTLGFDYAPKRPDTNGLSWVYTLVSVNIVMNPQNVPAASLSTMLFNTSISVEQFAEIDPAATNWLIASVTPVTTGQQFSVQLTAPASVMPNGNFTQYSGTTPTTIVDPKTQANFLSWWLGGDATTNKDKPSRVHTRETYDKLV